ncbi:MAG: lipopolysaccharide biosynthesis protein [Armatimonadota bacterium]
MQVGAGAELNLTNLGSRARTAIGWKFLSQGLTTGLQTISSIMLARLLEPKDFGILGMALMVTGLANIFRDLGLGQALIQRKSLEKTHLVSAYWGTMVMGALLAGLTLLLAPYIGEFFREPRMIPVLRVMSITFVLSPFATIPNAMLQRELDFKRPLYAAVAGAVAYAAVGLAMALHGYSYWSLAGALLASTIASVVAICITTRHLPPLIPCFRGLRDLYGFGVGITGAGFFNYIAQQADYFVVGRWLDSAQLGLYTRAFTLVHTPVLQTGGALSSILFPAFAKMQSEPERARSTYSKIASCIALVLFPGLTLLAVSASELVPVVFGEQWLGAVVPIRIMALAGMARGLLIPCGSLINAFGRVRQAALVQLLYAVLLFGAARLGVRWGINGVAVGAATALLSIGIPFFYLCKACCGVTAGDLVRASSGGLVCSVAVAAFAWESRSLLQHAGAKIVPVLAGTLLAGLVGWLLSLRWNPFQDWRELYRLVRR